LFLWVDCERSGSGTQAAGPRSSNFLHAGLLRNPGKSRPKVVLAEQAGAAIIPGHSSLFPSDSLQLLSASIQASAGGECAMPHPRLIYAVLRWVLSGILIASACALTGCTPAMKQFSPSNLWHNMQPHRLQQLNRGPGLSSDAYFSVSDPIDRIDDGWRASNETR
jgi:hypothetical protein